VRVLVVDDERAARQRLAMMLEELDVEVVGEAENGLVALEMARERRPDLVLLDIQMPEVDGFDVARHLPEPRPLIVFQTAYDEYALRAFDHAALDYLVKPVSMDRLRRAIERGRARSGDAGPAPTPDERLLQSLRAASAAPPVRARLLVRDGAGYRLQPLAGIERFAADDGAVYAHGAARWMVDYTLRELQERVGAGFVRASRSELVNVDHVARIVAPGDGSTTLVLAGGTRIPVSRRQSAEVWRALGK
jgi:DNA-binding LytR/AlgR family response regulator